ncbi:MAG: hypothetical protein HY696_08155 [Deltaproteobacteria bacterium]|nr:hypothetical protein [Deltaproteobacteria bacterium]
MTIRQRAFPVILIVGLILHPMLLPVANASWWSSHALSAKMLQSIVLDPTVGIMAAERAATAAMYTYYDQCRVYFDAVADHAWQIVEGLQSATHGSAMQPPPLGALPTAPQRSNPMASLATPDRGPMPPSLVRPQPATPPQAPTLQQAATACQPYLAAYVQQEALLQQQIETWWNGLDASAIHQSGDYREPIQLAIHEAARAVRKGFVGPGHTDLPELKEAPQCGGDFLRDGLFGRYLLAAFRVPGHSVADYAAALQDLQRQLGCISPSQSARLDLALRAAAEFVDIQLTKRGYPQLRDKFHSAWLNPFLLVADANGALGATYTYRGLRTFLTPSVLHPQNSVLPGGQLALSDPQRGSLVFFSTCDDSGVFDQALPSTVAQPLSARTPAGGVARQLSQSLHPGSSAPAAAAPATSDSEYPPTGFGVPTDQAAKENCPSTVPAWRNMAQQATCRYPLSALQFILDPVHQGHGVCAYHDMLRGDGKCKLYLCGNRTLELAAFLGGEGLMADFTAGTSPAPDSDSATTGCELFNQSGTFKCLDQLATVSEGAAPFARGRSTIGGGGGGGDRSGNAVAIGATSSLPGNWSEGCNGEAGSGPIDVGGSSTEGGDGEKKAAKETDDGGEGETGSGGEDSDDDNGSSGSNGGESGGSNDAGQGSDGNSKGNGNGDQQPGQPDSGNAPGPGSAAQGPGAASAKAPQQNVGENLARQANQQPGHGAGGGPGGNRGGSAGQQGGGSGTGSGDRNSGGAGSGSGGSGHPGGPSAPATPGAPGRDSSAVPMPDRADPANRSGDEAPDLGALLEQLQQRLNDVEDPTTGAIDKQHPNYPSFRKTLTQILHHPQIEQAHTRALQRAAATVGNPSVGTAIGAALNVVMPDVSLNGLPDAIAQAITVLQHARLSVAKPGDGDYSTAGTYYPDDTISIYAGSILLTTLRNSFQGTGPDFVNAIVRGYQQSIAKTAFHEVVAHAVLGALGANGSTEQEHDLLAVTVELLTGETGAGGAQGHNTSVWLVNKVVKMYGTTSSSGPGTGTGQQGTGGGSAPHDCGPGSEGCGTCNLVTQQALHLSQCLGLHQDAGALAGSPFDASQQGGFGLLPPKEGLSSACSDGFWPASAAQQACPMQMCGPGEVGVSAGSSGGSCTCQPSGTGNPKALRGTPWHRSSTGCPVVDCASGTVFDFASCQCHPEGAGMRGLP